MAYTPGLEITEATVIRKERRLPIPGKILVKKGEKVKQDTIVAETDLPGDIQSVRVAQSLNIDFEDIELYMTKKIGEPVEKDEVIAKSSSFFGLFKNFVKSPMKGTIELISPVSGQVIIRSPPKKIQVNAYIPGKIVDITPKEGVVIESTASFIQGIFGIGGETYGEIMIVADSPSDILTPEKINSDCKGKILVGGALVTGKALDAAVVQGVKGIIVGGIEDKELTDYLKYEIGVAITGHEEGGVTLILTEGFGKMRISSKTFNIMKRAENKLACINGATQIRAGVIRPEIIIPLEEKQEFEEKISVQNKGLEPNAQIRIIREPYFGALGRIISLPPELKTLESRSKVRVLEAELDDGRIVMVPRANVEMVEWAETQ